MIVVPKLQITRVLAIFFTLLGIIGPLDAGERTQIVSYIDSGIPKVPKPGDGHGDGSNPVSIEDLATKQIEKINGHQNSTFIGLGESGSLKLVWLSANERTIRVTVLHELHNALYERYQALEPSSSGEVASLSLIIDKEVLAQHPGILAVLNYSDYYISGVDGHDSLNAVHFDKAQNKVQMEYLPGLLFELDGTAGLIATVTALRGWLHPDDVRVMSIFDQNDYDIHASLDKAAGAAHVRHFDLANSNPATYIQSNPNKMIVLVGHIEDRFFVARRPDSSVAAQFEIPALEEAANKVDATIILLGCEGGKLFSNQTGYTSTVRDIDVANKLAKAMQTQSYGGFLAALAGPDMPFIIRSTTVENARFAAVMDRRRFKSDAAVSVTWAQFLGRATPPTSPIPAWWLRALTVYAGSVLVLIFLIPRTAWRAWTELLGPAPFVRRDHNGVNRILRRAAWVILRTGGFLMAAPVAFVFVWLRKAVRFVVSRVNSVR